MTADDWNAVAGGMFGLVIGSFLNVCVHRLPRDLSVVQPRSRCPRCDRQLAWYDNIPVLSYLLLRARCRYCRAPISIRYPLLELVTAAVFAAIAWRWGFTAEALKWAVFDSIMLALVFTDLETRILPDEFTKGGIWAGFLFALAVPVEPGLVSVLAGGIGPPVLSLAEALFAAGFASGILWAVGALYARVRGKEGLGFGDVKMIAMMGAFLGLPKMFLALVLGSLSGAVLGVLYIAVTKKDASTYALPFGSFLGAAAIAATFLS